MSRTRVFTIAVALLLAGAATAIIALRIRAVDSQAGNPGRNIDFATDLEQRPECWVKVNRTEQGQCPQASRSHKGDCFMANWTACAEDY